MFLKTNEVNKYNRALFFILVVSLVCLAFQVRFVNSLSILLLVVYVLVNPERKILINQAFSNYFFLAFLALYILQLIGLLYTYDSHEGWTEVTKKAGFVAIPFFFCAIRAIPRSVIKNVMIIWTISLVIVSLVCLINAAIQYQKNGISSVFFYHQLMSPFRHHAVFFSFFIFYTIVYWGEDGFHQVQQRGRVLLILVSLFFCGMIFLLSSKIVLGLTLIYILYFVVAHSIKLKSRIFLAATIIVICLVTLIFFLTDNPVKKRYYDLVEGNSHLFSQEKFSPDIYFNGLQFRLLTWRFTYEILNEKHKWAMGVSPGNAQHELDKKYYETNMYLGDGTKDKGFQGYNCHNVYLQTLLETGITGLCFLLIAIIVFIRNAIRKKNTHALIYFLAMIAFGFTESTLSTQYAILLFLFFPLLSLSTTSPEEG